MMRAIIAGIGEEGIKKRKKETGAQVYC